MNYKVELNTIALNRKPGISGMMRVKNDEEFIESCVESCIDALDELVIVYNDCTDGSPMVINKMKDKYPNKIKVYEYTPVIKAWNLNREDVDKILGNNIDAENTLAGYYNFALSKTTCEYVMKVDADQIYCTPKLIQICDAYRTENSFTVKFIPKLIYLYIIRLCLSLSIILNINMRYIYKPSVYRYYYNSLIQYISIFKPDVSMSGVNLLILPTKILIPLGKTINSGLNILPPFNGESDHPIFKVTNKTIFVPTLDKDYNALNKCNQSVIEKLIGLRKLWIIGTLWIHLNACRKKNRDIIYKIQLENPDFFVDINDWNNDNYEKLTSISDSRIFNKLKKQYFHFISYGMDSMFKKIALNQIEKLRDQWKY